MIETFFDWAYNSSAGFSIRASAWKYPAIEIVHLMGLVLLFGTVLIPNLRLLGLMLRDQAVADVAHGVARWRWIALTMMVPSGSLMFLAEAMRLYDKPAFFVKMSLVVMALAFQYTAHLAVTGSEALAASWRGKAAALSSLAMWFGVAFTGLWVRS
jgi:hypothetical protein